MIFQSYVTVYQRVYLDAKGNNMQFCAGFRSQRVLVMKIYRKKSSRQPGVISPFLPEALGSRRETYSSVPKFNHHPSRPIMVEHWPQLGTHEMMNMSWWNDGFCSPWSYYDHSVHMNWATRIPCESFDSAVCAFSTCLPTSLENSTY